jgi:hypothetical protein
VSFPRLFRGPLGLSPTGGDSVLARVSGGGFGAAASLYRGRRQPRSAGPRGRDAAGADARHVAVGHRVQLGAVARSGMTCGTHLAARRGRRRRSGPAVGPKVGCGA